jgi:protein FRG1
MPIKPLSFKGDKKPHKKRKREAADENTKPTSTDLVTSNPENGEAATEEDDTWVSCDLPSDLTGPTLLVLPTTPPTALASDPHGNIFASPLENVIDGDPATAEPHDVRQVWIATRIAGTAEGQVNFKSAHGKYLGCDTYGILSAKHEAIGREEVFSVIIAEESATGEGSVAGMFAVKTAASTQEEEGKGKDMFICATGGGDEEEGLKHKSVVEVRGDGDGISYTTTLRIRMQARFKPRLKANKEMKAKEKISRRELEAAVGRKLDDDEVKRLKRARRDGTYYEEVLDVRVKGKHDKFAS